MKLKAYEKAHDAENQIRLLLRHLNKANEVLFDKPFQVFLSQQAVKLAQESRSIEGSKMVAK